MSISVSGHLAKMQVELSEQVQYFLPLDDHREPLNTFSVRLSVSNTLVIFTVPTAGDVLRKALIKATATPVLLNYPSVTAVL